VQLALEQRTSVLRLRFRPSADLISDRDLQFEITYPPLSRGVFYALSKTMTSHLQPIDLQSWQRAFYAGDRLRAEVELFGSAFLGQTSHQELLVGCALLKASHGHGNSLLTASPFQKFQAALPDPKQPSDSCNQYLAAADCPDALMFWALTRHLPAMGEMGSSRCLHMLSRTAQLLMQRYPQRPDLPYQLLMLEPTGSLLKLAPKSLLHPGQWYSKPQSYFPQLQVAWVQGRFESMWLGSLKAHVDGRYFPLSDHHIRGFSVIGEAERCLNIFKQLYTRNPIEFQAGSISNLLFSALGCEQLSLAFVASLVVHFERLAKSSITCLPAQPPLPQRLEVHERPLMVVVSSDLRNHPVGRFWLPLARQLRSRFRLIHVAGCPRDRDFIRSELQDLSDEWWPLEASDVSATAARIRSQAPSLLLDLGGHTADNHPTFLSHRLAAVQATYLGFYGPTYASCCDWWIVDQVLERWLACSYPGAENLWALPGPSLCYLPSLHCLPDVQQINYREPNNLVFGSFNHTRKLTRASQQRFGEVLRANPDAVLLFRSHSFQDPAVRRRFLIRLQDMGIAPHQMQPLPYAPSSAAAMADYGRVHLHFDTFPVSGTTTTLDSLAMGIPVLTCPTPYYAGAISAAILEHAGLADHVCADPAELPSKARSLAERYRSAAARRALAQQVRESPICDDQVMPRMFVDQLQQMLRQTLSS